MRWGDTITVFCLVTVLILPANNYRQLHCSQCNCSVINMKISIWPSQKLIQQILRFLVMKQNLIFHIIGVDIENFSNSFHQLKFSNLIRNLLHALHMRVVCINMLSFLHSFIIWLNNFKGFLVWSWQTIFSQIQSTVQTFNWENKKKLLI